jgi:hypothetical protein
VSFYEGFEVGILKIEESEFLCTDSTALDCGPEFEPQTSTTQELYPPHLYSRRSISPEFHARRNAIHRRVTDRQKEITLSYIRVLGFTPARAQDLMSVNITASRAMTSCILAHTD